MEDLDGLIQQIYRDQDLTQGEKVPSHSHPAGPSACPPGHDTLLPPGRVSESSLKPRWKGQNEMMS